MHHFTQHFLRLTIFLAFIMPQFSGGAYALAQSSNPNFERGRSAGLSKCKSEEERKAYDKGYREGYRKGEPRGEREGYRRGDSDGESEGYRRGDSDGQSRADNDARVAATPEGHRAGLMEAEASNASYLGTQEGGRDGERRALSVAKDVDYREGWRQKESAIWAEPLAGTQTIRQKPSVNTSNQQQTLDLSNLQMRPFASGSIGRVGDNNSPGVGRGGRDNQGPGSDTRNPTTPQPSPAEDKAAYESGFAQGCQEARSRDYRSDYNRGHRAGENEGYQRAYKIAYDRAYHRAYDSTYHRAFDSAYSAHYQNSYNRHYESARTSAYRARYQQLYDAAYKWAFQESYARHYPKYAAEYFALGMDDATRDYQARPVRFVAAQTVETIVNGLIEPGEEVRFELKIRSFTNQAIAAQDLQLGLKSSDGSLITIPLSQEVLAQGLKGKHQATIQEALQVFYKESAVGRRVSVEVTLIYKGRQIDSKSVMAEPKYLLDVRYAQAPEIKVGLPTQLTLKVTNQSNRPASGGQLNLVVNKEVAELLDTQLKLPTLQPGEVTQVAVGIIGRKGGDYINLQLSAVALMGNQRLVGRFEVSSRVAHSNDYDIRLKTDLKSLNSPGIHYVQYRLTNKNSQRTLRSMQLEVEIAGLASEQVVVIGPNPQYIKPLLPGEYTDFMIPVLVKDQYLKGELLLKVTEDGQDMYIEKMDL